MKSRNVEKLGKLLCKWIDSKGKMSRRPKNLSLLMIGYMQYVYNVLKSGRKVKFLMSE
ncbi:MAG: hypothetical protein IJG36_09165 [Synergistaceae bacterium]|nr:hypothetical protein [Synergistaceae bacterium]